MRRSAQDCQTLAEYRAEVLRLPQQALARIAGCKQSWISAVERGHLPRTWNRSALLSAYRLEGANGEEEFVRMVTNARRLDALRTPIADDFPLAQFMQHEPKFLDLPGQPGEAKQA